MSRFKNKLCPVCERRFGEDDDIVVCPECGTPHHRECFMKNNACGIVAHHIDGFVWKGRLPWETSEEASEETQHEQHEDENNNVLTSQFGTMDDSALFSMDFDPDKMYKEYIEMVNDDRITVDGVSRKELYTFVNKSVMHYSTAFEAYRATPEKKAKISVFNFAAGLFKPMQQFYRRMDGLAIAIVLFDVLLSLPMLLMYSGIITVTEQNEWALTLITFFCNLANFVVTVLMCLFFNRLYYKHAVKKIKKIRARFKGERTTEYYAALAESGKPSWLRVIIGFLFEALIVACVIYLPIILAA